RSVACGLVLRRILGEQELDGDPVGLKTKFDHVPESAFGLRPLVELEVCQVDAVEHTQLEAAWSARRLGIEIERLLEVLSLVRVDGVTDQRRGSQIVDIRLLGRIAEPSGLAALDVGIGRLVLGKDRAVLEERRRRRIDSLQISELPSLRDDLVGLE